MRDRASALEYIRHRDQMADLQTAGYPITRTDTLYGAELERGITDDDSTKTPESTPVPRTVLYDVSPIRPIPHPRKGSLLDTMSSALAGTGKE